MMRATREKRGKPAPAINGARGKSAAAALSLAGSTSPGLGAESPSPHMPFEDGGYTTIINRTQG